MTDTRDASRLSAAGPGTSRAGFSFIEVLACLIVLGLGVSAAVGMVMYGVFLASRAQGMALGMSTAMTIAVDGTPLLPRGSTWNGVAGSGNGNGFINGLYVTRKETSTAEPGRTLPAGFTSCMVDVDVYDTFKGRIVTSYSTRVLRQVAP